MNKMIAEFIGPFTLVLFGCGAAVIAGADIGLTGISFAFGLALVVAAIAIVGAAAILASGLALAEGASELAFAIATFATLRRPNLP